MTMASEWGKASMAADSTFAKSEYNFRGPMNTEAYIQKDIRQQENLLKKFRGQKVWRTIQYSAKTELVQTNFRFPDGSLSAWTTSVITPEEAEATYGAENRIEE